MSEEKVPKTPLTKSEVKYHPMYEHYGTRYPVIDIHPGAFHSLVGTVPLIQFPSGEQSLR
jgi:hypothetical protein